MYDDEPKEAADEAATSDQDSATEGASSAAQVSDITTESQETQVEAEALPAEPVASPVPTAKAPVKPEKPNKNRLLSYENPVFDSPVSAVEDLIEQVEKSLKVEEDLMMTFIQRANVSESYYRLWREEANLYFRSLCILRKRLERMQANAAERAAKERQPPTSDDQMPKQAG